MSIYSIARTPAIVLAACLSISVGSAAAQGITKPKQGQGGTRVLCALGWWSAG